MGGWGTRIQFYFRFRLPQSGAKRFYCFKLLDIVGFAINNDESKS